MNMISHPHWVKLCVELNYAPNQNTKIPSSTASFTESDLERFCFIFYLKKAIDNG